MQTHIDFEVNFDVTNEAILKATQIFKQQQGDTKCIFQGVAYNTSEAALIEALKTLGQNKGSSSATLQIPVCDDQLTNTLSGVIFTL